MSSKTSDYTENFTVDISDNTQDWLKYASYIRNSRFLCRAFFYFPIDKEAMGKNF